MNQESEYLPEILISLKEIHPFRVPNSYFDSKPESFINNLDNSLLKDLGITQKNIFTIPKNYFENSIESTLHMIQLEKSLRDRDYRVPKDYFETLNERVLERIQNEPKPIVRRLHQQTRMWIGIAAMFIVVSGLFLFRNFMKPSTPEFNLSQIDDETLFDYLASNDYDLNNITDIIDDQEISNLNTQEENIDESELNEYIDNL